MNKQQAFAEKLQAQLDEWNARIDVLKAKAAQSRADAKVEYFKTIEELEKKRNAARADLEKFRQAGSDAWEDLREGIEQSWSNLRNAIEKAVARFR